MNISCLEELQMKLDLCLSREERLSILKDTGSKTKTNKWFVVTNDGQCHLFDKNGILDDVSKITELSESCIRKDIKRIRIPDSVISIGNWAFYYCDSLTHISIPDSVTSIRDHAFDTCISLMSATIPDGMMSIGDHAFKDCYNMTSVTIPNNVVIIGKCAFDSCTSLTSVTIPDSVTNIGNYAFSDCSDLMRIIFRGKTLDQVKTMNNYPWGIDNSSIIHAE